MYSKEQMKFFNDIKNELPIHICYNILMKYMKNISPDTEYYRTIPGWFDFDKLYSMILTSMPISAKVVEVGAFAGKSTSYLATRIKSRNQAGQNLQLSVVDTWQPVCDKEQKMAIEQCDNDIYGIFCRNMINCYVYDMLNIIQSTSVEASKRFQDNSLYFVFIDANHSYNNVVEDIQSWLPKIMPNGIIAGHDYDFEEVKNAVQDTFKDKKIEKVGRCWLYRNK